jgi:hypothetical protein
MAGDLGEAGALGHFREFDGFLSGSASDGIPANIEGFRNSGRPHGGDDYALIAVISGWMPMMFMTRVRL